MLSEYTEGAEVYFQDVKTILSNIEGLVTMELEQLDLMLESVDLLDDININLNAIRSNTSKLTSIQTLLSEFKTSFVSFTSYFQNTFDKFISGYYPPWDSEFPEEIAIYNGWFNFFSAFGDVTLHDYIMNIVDEIERQTNPVSDDNKDNFEAALLRFQTTTIVSDFNKVSDAGNSVLEALQSASPTSHLYFTTLPATFFGVSIPAYSIDLDFSWYGRYREQAHNVLSAFMWISWLFLIWRRIPAIISGAPMDIFSQHDDVPDVVSTDHITVDDRGTVTSHSTVNRYSDGTVVTQKHDVGGKQS